jgi:ABC-type nitrate/sulfonate/bicarbonate transport system substrate-binding protein
MTGSHPYLFFLHDALSTKVCVAAVDEDEGVGITVVTRKTQLLEPRRTIIVVFPGSRAVAGRRALSGQGLDGSRDVMMMGIWEITRPYALPRAL